MLGVLARNAKFTIPEEARVYIIIRNAASIKIKI
jgi:hypothetical protein